MALNPLGIGQGFSVMEAVPESVKQPGTGIKNIMEANKWRVPTLCHIGGM